MTDDRTEWLAWRRRGIGGSDVAAILGISPWGGPWSVYASKVTDVDDAATEAMEFGLRAEPMLAEWFHDRTGLYVVGAQERCEHAMASHRRCTVDGFVAESPSSSRGGALGVAEWKTTSDSAAEWAEQVPDHYATQAAWSMHVTGLDRVWFGVLHLAFGRPTFRVYEFTDRSDEDLLVKAVDDFWFNHVMLQVPPADVDGTKAERVAMNSLWRNPQGRIVADTEAEFWFDELLKYKAEERSAAAGREVAEAKLKALIGDHEQLDGLDLFNGGITKLATWKWQHRTKFAIDRFRQAYPDLAREFTEPDPRRVLLTFGSKEE